MLLEPQKRPQVSWRTTGRVHSPTTMQRPDEHSSVPVEGSSTGGGGSDGGGGGGLNGGDPGHNHSGGDGEGGGEAAADEGRGGAGIGGGGGHPLKLFCMGGKSASTSNECRWTNFGTPSHSRKPPTMTIPRPMKVQIMWQAHRKCAHLHSSGGTCSTSTRRCWDDMGAVWPCACRVSGRRGNEDE